MPSKSSTSPLQQDDVTLVDKRPFGQRPEYFKEAFTQFSTGHFLTSTQKWELASAILPLGHPVLSAAYPGTTLWAQRIENAPNVWTTLLYDVELVFWHVELTAPIRDSRNRTLADLMARLHSVDDRQAWDLAASAVIAASEGKSHEEIERRILARASQFQRERVGVRKEKRRESR